MDDLKEIKKKRKRTSIGGQAVLEGVMMRGNSSMAVAVRDEDGIIRLQTKRHKPMKKRNIIFRIPLLRGVFNFLAMMITGVGTLLDSASIYGEDEPSKFEKWCAKKLKINLMDIMIGFAVVLGLALALGIFFILPSLITKGIETLAKTSFDRIVVNLIEGGVRLVIFVSYLLLVSLVKDIKRLFRYHGAEHKVINCYEKGLDLTVKNVQSCSTVHNRCGTTFMFFVMIMSIVVFSLFGGDFSNMWARIGVRIALLPLVAGISYELLKLLALSDSWILFPLKAPGLLLQKITTKQPSDDMVEVSLSAFNAVLEMDKDDSIQTVAFVKPRKIKEFHEELTKLFVEKGREQSEVDWIFCNVLSCKRGEIFDREIMKIPQVEKVNGYVAECLQGKPLQYVLGETEFYGYKIQVNPEVLIPRFDTEILAEQVINYIKTNGKEVTVLDVCAGSGAIAIAVAKETNGLAKVVASDISSNAINVAKSNVEINKANVEVVQSDMFECFSNRKFDVIVSNPPYITNDDIQKLDAIVKDYEPHLALCGGNDGLDFYKILAAQAFSHLNVDGVLFMEVGINQAESVYKLFDDAKFNIEIIKDLCNIDRIVKVTQINI